MVHNLISGLSQLKSASAIGFLVAGSVMGMFIGVIPGLGGVVVLSLALAFIYHISLTETLCLFLGVQAASYFSASTTSILLNAPAHPEAFAVTFDGFPMAQRGEAGRALGISATATCVGGIIGCAVFIGFVQILNQLPTYFHPPELVALTAIAMLLVGTLGTDSATKALMSAGIGLLLSSVGPSTITEQYRFTFGAVGLDSGISLVALALGCFALPQMILLFGVGRSVASQDMLGREVKSAVPVKLSGGFQRQVFGGIVETLSHPFAVIRAGLIGVGTGLVPGVGGFAANFLSYGVAQQSSKKRELFGTGIAEGIIAPEGSSLSKEAGGLVPLIGLGIPGGVGGALFIAALTIKDLHPGYGFTTNYPSLPYEMAWIIALGGLIGTACGLAVAPILARITRVPGPLLVPIIMAFSVVGTFVATTQFFAVVEVLVFAVVGVVLRRLRFSLAAFAVGLVLGPTFETNIYLTRNIYRGWSFLGQPLVDVLVAGGVAILILKTIQFRKDARRRNQEWVSVNAHSGGSAPDLQQVRARYPYPVLAFVTTVSIAVICFSAAAYAGASWSTTTAILPAVGGGVAGLAALCRLPEDVRGYLEYRRAKRSHGNLQESKALVPVSVGAPDDGIELRPTIVGPPGEELSPDESEVSRTDLAPVRENSWGINGQYTREVAAFAWFAALIVACFLFGFEIGCPLVVALYGLTTTRRYLRRWSFRLVYSLVAAGALFAVIVGIFQVLHLTFTPAI